MLPTAEDRREGLGCCAIPACNFEAWSGAASVGRTVAAPLPSGAASRPGKLWQGCGGQGTRQAWHSLAPASRRDQVLRHMGIPHRAPRASISRSRSGCPHLLVVNPSSPAGPRLTTTTTPTTTNHRSADRLMYSCRPGPAIFRASDIRAVSLLVLSCCCFRQVSSCPPLFIRT